MGSQSGRQFSEPSSTASKAWGTAWKPTRRTFVQVLAGASASLILSKSSGAEPRQPDFWWLERATGRCWPVHDPVVWALANARQPILARARERLLKLTDADHDRIVRLVTRRCGLNLLEVFTDQVVVHFWGRRGLADLRSFFKSLGLAQPEVKVLLVDRKRESATVHTGTDFLYGDQLSPDWPLDVFVAKWNHHFQSESDDWSPAPKTRSGFSWEGIDADRIPWAALKSAWRKTSSLLCSNCDEPTLLTNFGRPQSGFLSRSPRFIYTCQHCRRFFPDRSVRDVVSWMAANLEPEVWPDYKVFWGDRRTPIGQPGM